jgi:C4-dicarboxylate transporter DctM subunit
LSRAFAATVVFFLCVASIQFIIATEKKGGNILAYGVPVWIIELVLHVGFGLVGLRLLYHSSGSWMGRIAATLLLSIFSYLALRPLTAPSSLVLSALAALLASTVFGAPVFVTLGGASLILFWGAENRLHQSHWIITVL